MASFCATQALSGKLRYRRCCSSRRPRSCTVLPNSGGRPIVQAVPRIAPVNDYPQYIPQTMEWAVAQARKALVEALSDDGRARKYWYQLSPRIAWMRETGVLAVHVADVVRGADVRIVLSENCGSSSCMSSWITRRDMLFSATQGYFLGDTGESTILFIVGVPKKHEMHLNQILEQVPSSVPVVLFNCFMDAPIERNLYPQGFVPTYMCRALKRCAFSVYGHRAPYSLYVEIAVFEYEWIADIDDKENFVPSQVSVERAAYARGSNPVGTHGYYKSHHRGCEAGFWPFMSLAAKYSLPLEGDTYREKSDPSRNRKRKPATSSKPFGFF